ncbi:hypothetical protein [Streptomyces sp. NPDC046985]|uniref:hypothetical protein n=1 Tax=Streptomyces sp. NPDC046985 TaxID=3155377 RepID=UPI0033C626E5
MVLGKGWKTSADRAVTTAADSDGLRLLVADSDTGYTWRTVTVLREPQLPAGTWIGNQCVMDDHRAAVAYAPRTFADKSDLMMGGAFTAIVNLDDGSVTKLPSRHRSPTSTPRVAPARIPRSSLRSETQKRAWPLCMPRASPSRTPP